LIITMKLIKYKRDKALQKYFSQPKLRLKEAIALILIGIIGVYIQWNGETILLIPGIVLGALGFILLIIPSIGVPSDSEVDKWLDDGIEKLKERSRSKLNLKDDDIEHFKPLVFRGFPLDDDFIIRLGKDDFGRCSVYTIIMIYLTRRHLAAYECDYNLINDLALNERTYEYYYRDIVGLLTEEVSSPVVTNEGKFRSLIRLIRNIFDNLSQVGRIIHHMPPTSTLNKGDTRLKFTDYQKIRISVINQESIEVVIDVRKYTDESGKSKELKLPATDIERAIGVIRSMLNEKKTDKITGPIDIHQGAKMPSMIECQNCGSPIQAGWSKCLKCEKPLPTNSEMGLKIIDR
jgi:hypothetical protein